MVGKKSVPNYPRISIHCTTVINRIILDWRRNWVDMAMATRLHLRDPIRKSRIMLPHTRIMCCSQPEQTITEQNKDVDQLACGHHSCPDYDDEEKSKTMIEKLHIIFRYVDIYRFIMKSQCRVSAQSHHTMRSDRRTP